MRSASSAARRPDFRWRELARPLLPVALLGILGAVTTYALGARLAEDVGVAFLELDQEIEREDGTSLSEIFLLYGQAGYRRYERRCLENLLKGRDRATPIPFGPYLAIAGWLQFYFHFDLMALVLRWTAPG